MLPFKSIVYPGYYKKDLLSPAATGKQIRAAAFQSLELISNGGPNSFLTPLPRL